MPEYICTGITINNRIIGSILFVLSPLLFIKGRGSVFWIRIRTDPSFFADPAPEF